jgi:hypothetical protein
VPAMCENLPDKVVLSILDKDKNGSTIILGNTTVEIAGIYNGDGLLLLVNILTPNTQYRKILYFYSR